MKNCGGVKASGMSGCGNARVLTHVGISTVFLFVRSNI